MSKKKIYNGYLRKCFTINGKKYQVYGKTPDDLFEKEFKKRQEIKEGQSALYNPTLSQYYDHFTEIRRKEIKEATIRTQQSQFKMVREVIMANGQKFGDMHIKEITRRNIEFVRQQLLDEGKSPQNLNNVFSHLNHVFHAAVIDETILKNPCAALKQLKRNKPLIAENRHRSLTKEETQKFFAEAEKRGSYYRNAFLLMVKTGMRLGEVCALYAEDIDIKNGFIHVRRTITRNEAGGYEVGQSAKTASGQRDIPLTEEILEILKAQEEQNRLFFGLQINNLLFQAVEGGILREYSLNREIKRICTSAGVDVFTCHCFRNTFATRFIEQRPQDYKILSEILGHKDVGITLNLYTHVMNETKIEAMKNVCIAV